MSGPSIKSVMNGGTVEEDKISVKEQHELFSRQDYFEPFSSEDLISKWKEYLTTLDERPSLKATLAKDPVLMKNWMVRIVIDNHVQEELIRNVKPQLVSWLRRELKNSAIDIVTEVREDDSKRFAYTDGEKFEEMLEKNPDLAYLKQKFNLDFDN